MATKADAASCPSISAMPTASSVRTARKLLSDPYRPGYHFVTPEGRCMPFDPNGAIFWKGRYHLFYIFQDARGHNWGHVSSTDLFHWRHHPTGLVSGMFSGNCFINKDGRPTMCYHQVGQGNAMAVAVDDELNEWKKLESNPITPKTAARRSASRQVSVVGPVRMAGGRHVLRHLRRQAAGDRQVRQPGRPVEVRRRPHGQHRRRRVDQRGRVLRRFLQDRRQAHAPVHQPPARLPLLPRRVEERAVSSRRSTRR